MRRFVVKDFLFPSRFRFKRLDRTAIGNLLVTLYCLFSISSTAKFLAARGLCLLPHCTLFLLLFEVVVECRPILTIAVVSHDTVQCRSALLAPAIVQRLRSICTQSHVSKVYVCSRAPCSVCATFARRKDEAVEEPTIRAMN